LDLLKFDADFVCQLLLRYADHPPTMADAFADMGVNGVLHNSLQYIIP
jgi:hypothetical protein